MLTTEEREKIHLEEEYRAEVRAQLASGARPDRFFDKVKGPLAILFATALVSGLLVPMVLRTVEDERRKFDLQSRLIEKIVSDDATAQTNLSQFRSRYADYQMGLLEVELGKRLLAVRQLDSEERQVRRQELQQDLQLVRTTYIEARTTFTAALHKHAVEEYKNYEWVALHYGTKGPVESYLDTARKDRNEASHAFDAYRLAVSTIRKRADAAIRTCADDAACEAIVAGAAAEIGKLRDETVDFQPWNDARQRLVRYISRTSPRI